MTKNYLTFPKDQAPAWHQVAWSKSNIVGERDASMPPDTDDAVDQYAAFCEEVGGSTYESITNAIDDVRSQYTELTQKVDQAKEESEVVSLGVQLQLVLAVYKSLQSYYDYYLRMTGTGD